MKHNITDWVPEKEIRTRAGWDIRVMTGIKLFRELKYIEQRMNPESGEKEYRITGKGMIAKLSWKELGEG